MNRNSIQQAGVVPAADGSSTQRAYVALRRLIIQGELKPGEKLKIDGLCKRLDTGASPVREALSLLASGHLVERSDQRGFRASPISRENFEEILLLRCTLEDMALRLSLSNLTEEWEENVVLCHHRMVRKSDSEVESFEERHKNFHLSLLANCNAPILLEFCSQLYDLNIRYRLLAGRTLSYQNRNIAEEHLNIMEAAISGDADLCSTHLLEHYRSTGAYLVELFDVEKLVAS